MSLIHELDAMTGCPLACFGTFATELAKKHGCVGMIACYAGLGHGRKDAIRLTVYVSHGDPDPKFWTFKTERLRRFTGTTFEFFDREVSGVLAFHRRVYG